MRTIFNIMAIVLIASVFLGCNKELPFDEQLVIDVELIDEYLAENGIDAIEDPSGLRYVIEEEGGDKKAAYFSAVSAKYKGTLMKNGKEFDANSDGFTFYLSNVIKGWQIGIPKVGVDGIIHLYIPSVLAYGSAGSGDDIPKNANLIFRVEVIAIN
ncbi:MAG: FKBP-type peptidyl-prolyl cis-trans isomerase [Cyclobacteriaceae bacterium]